VTFGQTQLVEMVMWQVQYVKKQGLSLAYSSHNPSEKLLTACQHWNQDITCLSDWLICRCHSHAVQTCWWPVQPNMFDWWQNSSISVYFAS